MTPSARHLVVRLALLTLGGMPAALSGHVVRGPGTIPAPSSVHATQPPDPAHPAPTGTPTPPASPESPAPAAPTEPPEAIVTMKDGQQYTGLLIERGPARLVIRIAGIDTPLPLSRVERVNVLPPVMDRYHAMRAAIDDSDADRLLMLVEWLRRHELWEPAIAELDHILQVQPDRAEASRLKLIVESQRDLAQKSAVRPAPAGAPAAGGPGPEFPLLSERDINLIKVYEVDLAEPPRMIINRATITRLMDEHPNAEGIPANPREREAMYRASPSRILDAMFRVQARELYGNVKVLDTPRSIKLFRDNVHRTLIANYCATVRCHGGAAAGKLVLTPLRPNADASVYTNFLILDRAKLADGTPLINYADPAKSPVLQYALPREMAAFKHPVVAASGSPARSDQWRPFYRSIEDRRYLDALEWVKAMYSPHPDYPIEYHGPAPEPVLPKPGDRPVVR